MEIKYITTAEIIETNRVLLEELEHEKFSSRDNYVVEEVVDSITRYCNTKHDLKEKILCKASFLLFELCTKHAFLDANKRTAMVSCFIFLTRNNVFPGFGSKFQKKLATYVKEIAQNKHTKSAIVKWLNEHVIYLSDNDKANYDLIRAKTEKEAKKLEIETNKLYERVKKYKDTHKSLSENYKLKISDLYGKMWILKLKANALREYSLLIKKEK